MIRFPVVDGIDFAVLNDGAPLASKHGEVWVDCSDQDDEVLQYGRFFADFGPLNLAQTYRFSLRLNIFTQSAKVVCYTRGHRHHTANAAALLAIHSVLFHGVCAQAASRPFDRLHLPPFRDAAFGLCTFGITVSDCASAVAKAIQSKLWSFDKFDAAAYDHLAQLEHGDMTWIVPGKVLAFSGPLMERREFAPTKVTMLAQDYAKVFNKMGVSCVVRLNEQCYDRKKFVHAGLNHVELIFPDGSTPADSILDSFLNLCERERGAVAVHCKAGLGRTGTVIAAYIIKHYRFTATEAIAWCRLCRPGCIVGPQQHFLAYKQASLWATPLPSNHQPPPKLKPQLQARKSFT